MWDDAHAQAVEEQHFANFVIDYKKNGVEIDLTERLDRGQRFDMGKLARHGITLDAETGRTIVNMPARGGVVSSNVSDGQEMSNSQIQEQIANRYAQYLSNQ